MNNMRKIPMRRETIKALEVRRNTVMGEARRRSTMQTLGANNEFNRNKNRHRTTAAIVGNTVERMSSDEERSNVTRSSVRHTQPTPQPVVVAEVRNSQM